MPNWCSTDYQIEGKEENVNKLFNDMKRVLSIDRKSENDGQSFTVNANWLGYIVEELLHKSYEDIPCRGVITDIAEATFPMDNNKTAFSLATETAWCDCRELFNQIATTYKVQIFFYTEECGCQIFETNDKEGHIFPMRYYMDTEKNGIEYYENFDDLADTIKEITGKRPNSLEELEDLKEDEENYITINEIDVI